MCALCISQMSMSSGDSESTTGGTSPAPEVGAAQPMKEDESADVAPGEATPSRHSGDDALDTHPLTRRGARSEYDPYRIIEYRLIFAHRACVELAGTRVYYHNACPTAGPRMAA